MEKNGGHCFYFTSEWLDDRHVDVALPRIEVDSHKRHWTRAAGPLVRVAALADLPDRRLRALAVLELEYVHGGRRLDHRVGAPEHRRDLRLRVRAGHGREQLEVPLRLRLVLDPPVRRY